MSMSDWESNTELYEDYFNLDLNSLAAAIHDWARDKGFWDHERLGPGTINRVAVNNPSIIPEKLMLVVTEIAEAMEGFRDGDEENVKEEIADSIIRLLDIAAYLDMDVRQEIAAKMVTNEGRPHMHGRKC